MADSSHLESMGRELKCPICLSLLKSAVSLTCNHAFCNSCISESMKSASNCPVCKVPYRRREVRAAPHMDNLVSIYKSMELALGIDIFVTQNAPCKITEDVEIQGKGDSNSDGAKSDEIRHGKRKKRSSKRKEVERNTIRLSDSDPSPKPSFPAKKRVRVPKCSLSETPTQPKKVSNLTSQSAKFQVERNSNTMVGSISQKNDSAVLKEKPVFNEKGDPVFQPFFWLRERDDDDEASEYLSAQQMEGDCLMDTSPFKAPCFSDIKDTDDGSSIKMTPNGEGSSEFKAADVFDSEMFEWTQRACSPELSLTPMKRQECEAVREIDTSLRSEPVISKSLKSLDTEQENENINKEPPIFYSKQNKSGRAKNTKKKRIKWHKGPNSKVDDKSATSSTGRPATVSDETVVDASTSPVEGAQISNQENGCTENANVETSERKHRKKHIKGKRVKVSMKQINSTTAEKVVILEAPSKSREVEGQNKGKKSLSITELPGLSCQQTENDKSLDKENKISTLKMKKCVRQSKNLYTDTSMTNVLEEIPQSYGEIMESQENIDLNMELLLQCPKRENGKTSGKKARERVTKFRSQDKRNITSEPKESKRLKIFSADATQHKATDEVLLDTNRSEEQEHPVEDLKFKGDNNLAKNTVLSATKDHNLQKCENVPKKIQCAFCQSGSDSEVSGAMLHYFDGKPVAANYNNGFNVIHAHRNCTEWAPNVYFESDIVINLETEIARSKRIKCSCCKVKGASLGCYEKSCRKSFHVPCAKLVPQCRWDAENFVMLCPLHSSSKLPKEIIGTQQQRRNRTSPKMDLQARTSVHPSILQKSENWKWPSALPSKWVICCSSLTAVEKEIVSNFTRMVGVSVSKTWSPAVTHVIASTDENGACKRTLKFLMGILEGKWILKIDWIKSCMTAMEPVSEEQFEISIDVHGIKNGPRCGRLRVMNKEPKLFNGLTFYFVGDFAPTYKGYLQNLVVAGGGIVLHRKPLSRDLERLLNESSTSTTFVIYSLEPPEKCDSSKKDLILNHRRAEAHTLAIATGANAAGHTWILDSIAACKLQKLT